eukprot:scaffold55745_cov66-Phaeocystis_antarctica.AAC.2
MPPTSCARAAAVGEEAPALTDTAATSSAHAAAVGEASTLTDAATSSAASCERRRQDAAASSTRVLAQPDGSHRFTGYTGADTIAEFNAADGIYTASVDGMYYVSVWPCRPLPSDVGFLMLAHHHASGATSVHTHIEPWENGLRHLAANDVLFVEAISVESGRVASAALKSALSGLSVSLRIELAMRKRKRVADLDDLDEKEAEAAAAAQRKRKRGATELEEGTGSSTEWSEGFSSDDEAKRRARPPKKMRVLARAARKLECAETETSESVAQDASLGSVDQTG